MGLNVVASLPDSCWHLGERESVASTDILSSQRDRPVRAPRVTSGLLQGGSQRQCCGGALPTAAGAAPQRCAAGTGGTPAAWRQSRCDAHVPLPACKLIDYCTLQGVPIQTAAIAGCLTNRQAQVPMGCLTCRCSLQWTLFTCRSSRGSQSESWMTTALMPGRSVPSPHDRAASRNSLCRERFVVVMVMKAKAYGCNLCSMGTGIPTTQQQCSSRRS